MATQMPERDDRTAEERVSMSELLASCAAASAVSTPPRPALPPEAEEPEPELRDEAA
ncbi:hypothetical protein [Streptomyces omiyaensis]|uniref:Uncharacterized protein n=1 Tax=Streptomyces omiyaensis TaxID=68247 RepID=A0ABW7BLZ9_9ACTN|nr:hypothetical protein [Streptomyces omiyaensis]GGY26466.1 hypothetical protein GCM10010363_03820 [Streptomyces omiyaensis]